MNRTGRAFTLLEVIVALAIIAIAFAVTIPVVAKARARSQEIFCQSNLRTLSTALMQYTMDNGDRYPYGFIFNRQNPNTGRPADGGNTGYITWFSLVDQYLTSNSAPNILLNFNSGFFDGATTRVFNAAFKCPSVPANYQQQVHYYWHGVVMPLMPLELGLTPAGRVKVNAPAKVNQVYANTALVWDTPVYGSAVPQTPSMFWISSHSVAGFNLPCTFIDTSDESRLCTPELPELRYRSAGADRFINSTNPLKHPAGPIAFESDAYVQAQEFPLPSNNSDAPGGTLNTAMLGGARFRHTGLGCNVLFADGSVRTLYLRPWRKVAFGPAGTGSALYIDSDFRRNMLMIKWPPGIFDSNTYPTN